MKQTNKETNTNHIIILDMSEGDLLTFNIFGVFVSSE